MNLPLLSWVDWALLAVLLVSVVVGLWRGLVFEVLSLVGWVVAFIVAQAFAPSVATVLPIGVPGSAINYGVAFLVTFVLALVLWALVSRLARLLIHATPLQPVDRVLGGVFGLARGLLIGLVFALLAGLTRFPAHPAWKDSFFGDQNQHGMEGVRFWTKVKTVTSRWPKGSDGSSFSMPVLR